MIGKMDEGGMTDEIASSVGPQPMTFELTAYNTKKLMFVKCATKLKRRNKESGMNENNERIME